ncbi:hypothetical protein RHOSPDRAFT_33102 [Rhodotorula sp. JG-1b]|nr:hypothetical protein RHOSPDRAFT_33102 [Rhodotorula sp. JG-1b]
MTTAGQQRIRIPTFQSPTSQAKTPAATQSRAEERAARIKVQGNNNWASLSVLAEVGPQNLSHLLENRRQCESEPVEQVAQAVSRRSAKAAVEPGHDGDARGGTQSLDKRAENSRHGSSTTQSSDSRSRQAADIVDSQGDEPATTKLRNNPRSPRKRARVVASGEPPRQSVERISAGESPQVDAAQASEPPRSLPNSVPPRARSRRPRAALAVATAMSLSRSPADALVRAHGAPSLSLAEPSSNPTTLAPGPSSRASKQSGTRPRTRKPQQSRDESTHTVLSPKPKKRARLRPVPQSPLSSLQVPRMAEADRAEPPLQPVDPAASRHIEKRPSSLSPRPKAPTRSRNPGSSYRVPPVPGEPIPAPPASASRASDPGAAEAVKIHTDRCYRHAASHPLNAFDILAGGTKKLSMQARWSAGPEGSAEVFADFAATLHEKMLRRAMLLSLMATTIERVHVAHSRLHKT